MSKLPNPVPSLKGEALKLYQSLAAKRGVIDGMYETLLNHPELTKHVSDLGTYLRFESTLEGKYREFIILNCAHILKAGYEWAKHVPPAVEAGLPQKIIDAIQNEHPLPEPYLTFDEASRYALNLRNIPEELQNKVIKICGVHGLLELVVLAGFYRMIQGIIACFDVPLPTDAK